MKNLRKTSGSERRQGVTPEYLPVQCQRHLAYCFGLYSNNIQKVIVQCCRNRPANGSPAIIRNLITITQGGGYCILLLLTPIESIYSERAKFSNSLSLRLRLRVYYTINLSRSGSKCCLRLRLKTTKNRVSVAQPPSDHHAVRDQGRGFAENQFMLTYISFVA
jgi:hypothetical protein